MRRFEYILVILQRLSSHLKFSICFLVSPKDVAVQIESKIVKEGGSALLVCSCKADPPAFQYHWSYSQQGRTVYLRQRTHMIRVFNVTRDMRMRCSAQNLIGRGESQLTPLNIQCKTIFLGRGILNYHAFILAVEDTTS